MPTGRNGRSDGPCSCGRRQTSYRIDGSTGDDTWGRRTIFTNLPLSAIQEFTVLPNSIDAAYARTTGAGNNGDGVLADRPVVGNALVGRNIGRGTPAYDFSPFAERAFRLSDRCKLTARAEAFNVFNHPNIMGRNGVYGSALSGLPLASFGQALGGINNVDPGREFPFVMRIEF